MTASVAANRLSTMIVVGRLACWLILSVASSVHVGIWPPVGRSVELRHAVNAKRGTGPASAEHWPTHRRI
ncbi:hypothetical protein T11_6316 [Trichinella zimbabwensis]|uniref:Uncharacterized protein n=1 Tax=Trichinella zimbabwensis TaxID=268475 RepID=A0A0V1H748_9BILA|nr:hypothetical protein T11_6316 [Trichinella zimbabwensis]